MKEYIIINNFGPLKNVEIEEIRPYTFLIGASGSGKSTLLKMIAFMRWIYKMMCIRSYLYYSGLKVSPFTINFKNHLKAMGMIKFLHSNTYIEYRYGDFVFIYDRKMRMLQKNVAQHQLSLEKISFISDKRGVIGDILENNLSLKKRAFYTNETFDDYLIATDAIRHFEMPSLGVQLQIKKTSNGEKHVIEPIKGEQFSINLNEASSGTQASIPLSLIVEYFSTKYNIVESLNDAVFRYAAKSDSLKDFRASNNVGELPNRRVSLFVEEPEISLYPSTQRTLMDSVISNCAAPHDYTMSIMVATHSPYIINHLNVLLRRKTDAPHIKAEDLSVYHVVDGVLQNLMMQDLDTDEWVVDTTELSEPMENIFNEYEALGV